MNTQHHVAMAVIDTLEMIKKQIERRMKNYLTRANKKGTKQIVQLKCKTKMRALHPEVQRLDTIINQLKKEKETMDGNEENRTEPLEATTVGEVKQENDPAASDAVEQENDATCESEVKVSEDFFFGEALHLLKKGHRLSRRGWNGKNQFIELQRPGEYSKMSLPYFYIMTVLGHLVPWVASQTDLLAEDWYIVG